MEAGHWYWRREQQALVLQPGGPTRGPADDGKRNAVEWTVVSYIASRREVLIRGGGWGGGLGGPWDPGGPGGPRESTGTLEALGGPRGSFGVTKNQ